MFVDSRPNAGLAIGRGVVLTAVSLLSMMGSMLMAPLLPQLQVHFQAVAHADILVPLLLTIPALSQGLLSPVAGWLVDKIGARPVLLWGLLVYGLAGVAPMMLKSLYGIFAARALVGVMEAGIVTAATALLAHYFSGDERQKWFAYQMVVLPLALVILLQTTGRLGDHGWRPTFAAYGVSWLMLLGAILIIPRQLPLQAVFKHFPLFPRWRDTALIVSVAVPVSILFYIAPLEAGFLLNERGLGAPSTISNALTIGVLAAPLGGLATRWLTKIPVGSVLAGGTALIAVALVLIANSSGFTGIAMGLVLQQFSGSLMLVTGLTYLTGLAPASERGRYAGVWWFFYLAANFATPLVAAALRAVTGSHGGSIVAIGLIGLAAGVWYLLAGPLRRPSVT